MKFPAYLTVKPYLATIPSRVGTFLDQLPMSTRADRRAPKVTTILGDLSKAKKDLSLLREPIHKLFVNWPSDLAGVIAFTKKYGVLDLNWFLPNPDDTDIQEDYFEIKIPEWRAKQAEMQKWWDMNGRKDPGAIPEIKARLGIDVPASPSRFTLANLQQHRRNWMRPKPFEVDWGYQGKAPTAEFHVSDLYYYMCFLVMFQKLGSLRRCQNPDCGTPRFIARRTDQVFCTTDCAELIAKRRWWAENGNAWRKQRKRLKEMKAKRGKR